MTTKLTINGVDIKLSKETQEELERKFKPRGLWKPEEGEHYYFLDSDGEIMDVEFDGTQFDRESISIGNYFKTRKEAKKHLDKLKSIQRVKEYIADNFGVFKPSNEEETYNIISDFDEYHNRFLEWEGNRYSRQYSPFGYLKNKEDAEKLIKECKEDLKTIFDIS